MPQEVKFPMLCTILYDGIECDISCILNDLEYRLCCAIRGTLVNDLFDFGWSFRRMEAILAKYLYYCVGDFSFW